jgi:hypothetical protein
MRPLLFVLSVCQILAGVPAHAERATLEFGGGIGDTSLRLIRGSTEIAESSTSLWRLRGTFVLPLSPSFSALFSYQRAGDGSGRIWYQDSTNAPVVSRERMGIFEIGFRIGL